MTTTIMNQRDGQALLASGAWLPAPLDPDLSAPSGVDLVSSARVVNAEDDDGVHWIQGFTVTGDPCGPDNIVALDPCTNGPGTLDPASVAGSIASYVYRPYLLVARIKCSTFGTTPDAVQTAARRILTGPAASYRIEQVLATGAGADAVNPALSEYAAGIDNAADPADHLAWLEQRAREVAPGLGRYMIHTSPRIATLWASKNLLRKEDGQLLTYLDTVVVAGAGYGQPTQAWITGIVTVRLGPVMESDAELEVDRSANTILSTVARFAAATWPACMVPQGLSATYPTAPV